jgi:hypothetical protein
VRAFFPIAATLGLAGAFHGIDEDAGLNAEGAAETLLGAGQLADVRIVEGASGVLLGEDGVAGAEAVGAGVGGDLGFALGSSGASGALGVAAIGVYLQLG